MRQVHSEVNDSVGIEVYRERGRVSPDRCQRHPHHHDHEHSTGELPTVIMNNHSGPGVLVIVAYPA